LIGCMQRGLKAIVHGGARGADKMAGKFARQYGIPEVIVPAQWDHYGKSAGPVRNKWMVDIIQVDEVLAFPGGSGTAHMVELAKRLGIKVTEV